MRLQSRKSSCGPAALKNALEAIGIERTEDELGALSKQTTEGTSQAGLERAIDAVGKGNDPIITSNRIYEQRREVAGWAISSTIRSGRPVIIVVDNCEHWVSVVGMLGESFIVADSASNDVVLYYSLEQLLDRWESDTGRYFGIIIK